MGKILVVDDSPAILLMVQDNLVDLGHVVETLPSSDGVVDRVRTWRPDVVLLDILLGPRNGWAVLADLHALPRCPAVYMMSAGFITSDAACRLLGAQGFVSKAGDFLGAVERAVGTT